MLNKKIAKLVVRFSVACMVCFGVNADEIKWQPVNGDWNGNFGDTLHWVGGKVPGESDIASFPVESSPAAFTVIVDGNYSVGSVDVKHFGAAGRTVTFSGSGKISSSSSSSSVNYFGANNIVVFDGVSLNSQYQCGCYGRVEISNGSTFTCKNNFYFFQNNNHSGRTSVIVNGGTCDLYRIICNGAPSGSSLVVYDGVLKTPNDLLGTYALKPVMLEVNGGVAEFGQLNMTIPGSAIKLTGGLLRITKNTLDALKVDQIVDVSLQGGTFEYKCQHSDPRFYATDGADVDMGTYLVYATNRVSVQSRGALITRGFRNGSTSNCELDGTFPKIIFTYPDGQFYVESGVARNFRLKGPTVIGTKCNMIVNPNALTSYIYFRGDLTVDTLDYADRTTPRTIWIKGLHPEDGEATLIVNGGGKLQLLEAFSYNSFKSVTIAANTELELLTAGMSSEFGPLASEKFEMKAGAELKFTAGGNYVHAKTLTIDPTAKITVVIPETFTTGARPVFQTADLIDPEVSLDQITLEGNTEGVYLKKEYGQISVCKSGNVDGTYATEWTGLGSDRKLGTAANWYGGVVPKTKDVMYFGASTVANPEYSMIRNNNDNGDTSTVNGYYFRDTATETFVYRSGGETVTESSVYTVSSYSHVPQIINGKLRRDGNIFTFLAYGTAPVILSGEGTFVWTLADKRIRTYGDVRLDKNGFSATDILFLDGGLTAPFSRLTVMPNISAEVLAQTDDFNVKKAAFRIETGATLTFCNGAGSLYRWTQEPAKHIVNGTLNIEAPFYGGVKQTYGGSGRMNIDSVKSGTAASRVQLADELNVYLNDWTTVTSGTGYPVALTAIGGTPTIHLASNWRYGAAEGITTSASAANRALKIEKGATLTFEANGNVVTFDEDISGEGTLVFKNGTLVVNSSEANNVDLKIADGGVLKLSDVLNFGSLEVQSGASILPAEDIKDSLGWQTVLIAVDSVEVSDCKLPSGIEMRTVPVEGGVALQMKYMRGMKLVIR